MRLSVNCYTMQVVLCRSRSNPCKHLQMQGITTYNKQTQGEDVEQQKEMRKHIQSDAVNKTINPEKQSRHDRNSDGYVPGRSYLLGDVDAQELVDRYHGTGDVRLSRAGDTWINKEFIIADKNIGINVNPKTGEETITNRFTIHYSGTGTHIVPTERRE